MLPNNPPKIGFLLGIFNPIHNGHILLAIYAQNELGLDKVMFVPTNIPQYKEMKVSPYHRCNMIKMALIKYSNKFFLQDVFGYYNEECSFLQTIIRLQTKYQNDYLFLILGNDYTKNTDMTWTSMKTIKKLMYIKRANKEFYMPQLNIRGTLIRDLVNKNKSIKLLVPDIVDEYIKKNRLYLWRIG